MVPGTFTASYSPDELLGQIVQILLPEYRVDAPHLLALRNVLSSAIIAPKKPPTLVRTRPDKRLGQIGSIYDAPQRSAHGPNGPPVSAKESFYFHHKDPDFEKLLPQVDRSGYDRPDRTVPEGIQDSTDPAILDISTPTLQQIESSESPGSVTACVTAVCDAKTLTTSTRCPKDTCQATEPAPSGTSILSLPLAQDAACEQAAINSSNTQTTSTPTTTIHDTDSEKPSTTNGVNEPSTSNSLLRTAGILVGLPRNEETISTARPPDAARPDPYPTDTQDTSPSTQQSDVFSLPVDFLPCTPPTQEDSQDEELSQISVNDPDVLTIEGKTNERAVQQPFSPSTIELELSPLPAPSWNKRSRETLEEARDAPPLKRSKTVS
ncbi:hypothetical protein N0V95_008903 [Ascochyta clinopodiicola]|nr:hypothetical protein N0V95_008903 [Ascochyta clinopodiicola]